MVEAREPVGCAYALIGLAGLAWSYLAVSGYDLARLARPRAPTSPGLPGYPAWAIPAVAVIIVAGQLAVAVRHRRAAKWMGTLAFVELFLSFSYAVATGGGM